MRKKSDKFINNQKRQQLTAFLIKKEMDLVVDNRFYQEYAVFLGIISLFTKLKIPLFKRFSRFFQKLHERMRKSVSRV